MSLLAGAFVVVAAFVTATVSGVLGMAGGLLLMGALLLVLPATTAFVAHGLLQLVSNGWRTWLHRRHVRGRIVAWYAAGSVTAGLAVAAVSYVPSKPLTYLFLGLVPALVWLPKGVLRQRLPEVAHVEVEGLRVGVVHETGQAAGREARCDAAHPGLDVLVFGHSHIPWDSTTPNGMRLLNPGSPTDRRRQPFCTYLTAVADRGLLHDVELVRLPRP